MFINITIISGNFNINEQVMKVYLDNILPEIAVEGDDKNYGSTAICDTACLQVLSKRIHYGKFVAEAKFQDPLNQKIYIDLIKAKDKVMFIWLLY